MLQVFAIKSEFRDRDSEVGSFFIKKPAII